MTLEQKINILYYICQSRIEELIFKSIFDYFDADKFYVITEKRDDIFITFPAYSRRTERTTWTQYQFDLTPHQKKMIDKIFKKWI